MEIYIDEIIEKYNIKYNNKADNIFKRIKYNFREDKSTFFMGIVLLIGSIIAIILWSLKKMVYTIVLLDILTFVLCIWTIVDVRLPRTKAKKKNRQREKYQIMLEVIHENYPEILKRKKLIYFEKILTEKMQNELLIDTINKKISEIFSTILLPVILTWMGMVLGKETQGEINLSFILLITLFLIVKGLILFLYPIIGYSQLEKKRNCEILKDTIDLKLIKGTFL